MALNVRNKDEIDNLNDKLDQILKQQKQIGMNLEKKTNDESDEKMNALMQRMKDLENRENKRAEQHNQSIKKLEDSTSNFNKITNDLHVKYKSVASSYLNKLNTDNQEQDFQNALDNKFKKIDNNTKTLMNRIIESNKQTRTEIQEQKKTLESKFQDNDKLIDKYNKSLSKMTQGISGLFFVVVIVALVAFVTGPIGDFFGVESLYSSINNFIDDHESPWRYLMFILYLVPYVCFTLILLLVATLLNAFERR